MDDCDDSENISEEISVFQGEMSHSYAHQHIQIDEATNGKEAVELFDSIFKQRCPNDQCPHPIYKLIIMDINMPVMNGYVATEKILEIRAQNPGLYPETETHIIALTSYTDHQAKEKCFSLGMKEVHHKPMNAVDLRRAVAWYHHGIDPLKYERYLKALEEQNEYLKHCQEL